MVNSACTHCGALLLERGLRTDRGVDWLCANCGRAGTYAKALVGRRNVLVRQQTVAGDEAMRRPWVLAESMPYAERVRSVGGRA